MSDSQQPHEQKETHRLYREETVEFLRNKLKDGLKSIGLKNCMEDTSTVNILEAPFCDKDGVILDMAEDIKRSVITERCQEGKSDELNMILEGAMLAFLRPVLQGNTKTRDVAVSFMNSTLQNFTYKYDSKLEKFLRIHTAAPQPDTILHSFHDELKIKLLAKYDHMKKPGDESFQNNYRQQLQEMFSKKSSIGANPQEKKTSDGQVALQKILDDQLVEHRRVLEEEAKTIQSVKELVLIHQQSKEIALEKLRNGACTLASGKNGILWAEFELKEKLYIAFLEVHAELLATTNKFILACQSELDSCLMKYKSKMRKVLESKPYCEESDLASEHRQISSTALFQFDSKLVENFNVLQKLQEDFKKKLEQKLENAHESYSDKWERKLELVQSAIKELTLAHSANLGKRAHEMDTAEQLKEFHETVTKRLLESFHISMTLAISNVAWYEHIMKKLSKGLENSYEKVSKEWELQIEVGLREVAKAYAEESEKLLSLTFPFNYHESACQAAISRCKSISSSRLQREAKTLLDQKYHEKVNNEPIVVGIDFGARYCRSAFFYQNTIRTIPHYDPDDKQIMFLASYVGVLDYSKLMGQCAQNILLSSCELQPPIIYDMKNIIYYWKNLGWIRDLYNWPFTAKVGQEGPIISGQDFEYPVATMISVLFRKLRENAEKFLKRPLSQCVVVVPHYFDPTQRTNILEAGRMAGFLDVTLLEKYNAAALALQFHNMRGNNNEEWSNKMRKILLLDFGTDFRFYVVQVFQKEMKLLYVYNWNSRGQLFHKNLMEYCTQQFIKSANVSIHELNYEPRQAIVCKRRLAESCNRGIISLSTEQIATVHVPYFFMGKDLRVLVTRTKFEEINASLFPSVCEQVNKVLNWAEVGKDNVSEIISTGGYSRIPKLDQVIKKYFVGIPINNFDSDPEQLLAFGAAIKGAMLSVERARIKKARSLSSSI